MADASADYLDRLAAFAVDTRYADLPRPVQERARWIFADCLAVIAAGMQVPEMKALVRARLDGAATGHAWVIGAARRAAVRDAAVLNGTAGTWLELDEGNTYAKGHPGIQILPAALAWSQQRGGVSGADLLGALALGYEVSSRINRAADILPMVHPHGTFGVIGAAVAIARLEGFDARRMREVLNIAACTGLATSYDTLRDGATVRNIYTGHSASMGLTAVDLVRCGFTGERDGVAHVYGRVLGRGWSEASVTDRLGTAWMLADGYFKLHPTARSLHSAIDALEDAIARAGAPIDAASVERIDVRTYRLAASKDVRRVTSSFGARFSIPFALATILHHGRSGLDCFEAPAVANEAIQALAAKVELVEDPACTARYPDLQICDVVVTLRDGRRIAGRCEVMKGEPGNPNREEEIARKFADLGTPVWGDERTRHLWHDCLALDRIGDIRSWSGGFEP